MIRPSVPSRLSAGPDCDFWHWKPDLCRTGKCIREQAVEKADEAEIASSSKRVTGRRTHNSLGWRYSGSDGRRSLQVERTARGAASGTDGISIRSVLFDVMARAGSRGGSRLDRKSIRRRKRLSSTYPCGGRSYWLSERCSTRRRGSHLPMDVCSRISPDVPALVRQRWDAGVASENDMSTCFLAETTKPDLSECPLRADSMRNRGLGESGWIPDGVHAANERQKPTGAAIASDFSFWNYPTRASPLGLGRQTTRQDM